MAQRLSDLFLNRGRRGAPRVGPRAQRLLSVDRQVAGRVGLVRDPKELGSVADPFRDRGPDQ